MCIACFIDLTGEPINPVPLLSSFPFTGSTYITYGFIANAKTVVLVSCGCKSKYAENAAAVSPVVVDILSCPAPTYPGLLCEKTQSVCHIPATFDQLPAQTLFSLLSLLSRLCIPTSCPPIPFPLDIISKTACDELLPL